jgi:transposase
VTGRQKTKNLKERVEQREKMWAMYKSGISKYRIAKIFGCHETNVGKIIRRIEEKNAEQDSHTS